MNSTRGADAVSGGYSHRYALWRDLGIPPESRWQALGFPTPTPATRDLADHRLKAPQLAQRGESKTVLTEIGPVEIEVSGDVETTFTPQIVRKRNGRSPCEGSNSPREARHVAPRSNFLLSSRQTDKVQSGALKIPVSIVVESMLRASLPSCDEPPYQRDGSSQDHDHAKNVEERVT